MGNPFDNPEETHPEQMDEAGENQSLEQTNEPALELASAVVPIFVSEAVPEWTARQSGLLGEQDALWKRGYRHNLFLLLSFTLAAFLLTTWIFVRVGLPFGIWSGPQEVVRAQLEALDRGELRPAYDMLSPRYRQQISFDLWREMIATHWRMFHAEVLSTGEPAQTGAGVTLEMHLRGADEKAYRAQFTLIRMDGRWWIDDLHWAEEPDAHGEFHA